MSFHLLEPRMLPAEEHQRRANPQRRKNIFNALGFDIVHKVLGYLGPADLASVAVTSKEAIGYFAPKTSDRLYGPVSLADYLAFQCRLDAGDPASRFCPQHMTWHGRRVQGSAVAKSLSVVEKRDERADVYYDLAVDDGCLPLKMDPRDASWWWAYKTYPIVQLAPGVRISWQLVRSIMRRHRTGNPGCGITPEALKELQPCRNYSGKDANEWAYQISTEIQDDKLHVHVRSLFAIPQDCSRLDLPYCRYGWGHCSCGRFPGGPATCLHNRPNVLAQVWFCLREHSRIVNRVPRSHPTNQTNRVRVGGGYPVQLANVDERVTLLTRCQVCSTIYRIEIVRAEGARGDEGDIIRNFLSSRETVEGGFPGLVALVTRSSCLGDGLDMSTWSDWSKLILELEGFYKWQGRWEGGSRCSRDGSVQSTEV